MRVLLVDDEFSIRRRILQQVDWASLGIVQVEEASDGVEALEKCKLSHFDILLTDVRMPKMDGIELATLISKQCDNIKIIFISGYTDKEYLQSAIALKATRYIEKPIKIDDLYHILQNTTKTILSEKVHSQEIHDLKQKKILMDMQDAAQYMLYKKNILGAEKILRANNWLLDQHNFFVSIVIKFTLHQKEDDIDTIFSDQVLMQIVSVFNSAHISALCMRKNQQLVIHALGTSSGKILMKYNAIEKSCRTLLEIYAFHKLQPIFGIGNFVDHWDDLYDSYESAILSIQQSFFKQPDCICFYKASTMNCYNFDSFHLSEFVHTLTKDQPDHAIFLIKNLTTNIKLYDNTLPTNVIRLYFSMIQKLISLSQKEDAKIYEQFENEQDIWVYLNEFSFLDQVSEFLITGIYQYYNHLKTDLSSNAIVNRIIRYIKQHYADPELCVSSISSYLNLSPTYICHLFKDVTNQTINKYLTDYRLQRAKEIMSDPNQKIKDIANQVGYRNGNYFSYQFKKCTGLSPREYIESLV